MFYSGLADEAGRDIAAQITAHRELGWGHIELRTVDGENVSMMSDAKFDAVYDAVEASGLQVSCFASAIANWSRPISGDPTIDNDELRRAIPRMHRFGTEFIRIMSYPNDPAKPFEEIAWRKESIKRIGELTRMAEDGGVTLLHENCSGWGGDSPQNNLTLLEEIQSPALRVVFDTGNPVGYGQDSWEYYQAVVDHIVYVHIKDGRHLPDGKSQWCFPGAGEGRVREIVSDLLARGYDGGFSIEPHIAAIIHSGEATATAQDLYESYIEYGQQFMSIMEKASD